MKLGYIINVHKNFSQLERLLSRLYCDEAYFFIHVDKKVGKDIFLQLVDSLSKYQPKFVENRICVNWGGFSQVQATLLGLQILLESRVHCEYVNFISGQDYPLCSNQVINNFFKSNQGKEFICYHDLQFGGWSDKEERVTKYHFPDYYKTLKIDASEHPRVLGKFESMVNRILPLRILPNGYRAYGGWSWWSLSIECVQYVFRFIGENRDFVNFFRYSLCPDEIFFQTIIMNSPYRERVVNDDLRYVVWSVGQSNPKTFEENDFSDIVSSNKLFARKFDMSQNSKILDLIDKNIDCSC